MAEYRIRVTTADGRVTRRVVKGKPALVAELLALGVTHQDAKRVTYQPLESHVRVPGRADYVTVRWSELGNLSPATRKPKALPVPDLPAGYSFWAFHPTPGYVWAVDETRRAYVVLNPSTM